MKNPWRLILLTIFCLFSLAELFASDSLQINLSKKNYLQKDSLEVHIILPDELQKKFKSVTMHVWIDDLKTKKRWKFRYPVIEGEVNAALLINTNIPDGNYAISCLVQNGFYRMQGMVTERDKKDSIINYMMRTANKKTMVDQVKVDQNGRFNMKPILFQDTARFYFSPLTKTKNNYLSVILKTPIDSAFEPLASNTAFFSIGNATEFKKAIDGYELLLDDPEEISDLPNVTVYSKIKTKVEQYEEAYVSGLFKNENATIFDGLENDQIANSQTLSWFLQQYITGLTIAIDADNNEVYKWREEICSIFIDEFEVLPGEQTMVFPRDIAMIKVFRPPFSFSSSTGFAGAIAIYTKKGKFTDNHAAKFSFVLKGYTPFDGIWK
jgi:hypothetical protein